MFKYSLLLISLIICISNGIDYGCNIFSNRFTVENGLFKDVCGGLSVQTNTGNLYSPSDLFSIGGGQVLTYPHVDFSTSQFGFVIQAKRDGSSDLDGIIIGPGSANCQIRYENNNQVCIYSYFQNPPYWQCIVLPYATNELHTLILHYNNGILNIYQNRQFVKSINNQFQISLARIGGWYNNQYPARITVKNIMFTTNVNYDDIYRYLFG